MANQLATGSFAGFFGVVAPALNVQTCAREATLAGAAILRAVTLNVHPLDAPNQIFAPPGELEVVVDTDAAQIRSVAGIKIEPAPYPLLRISLVFCVATVAKVGQIRQPSVDHGVRS
jgi:hypothetical protein